MFSMSVCNILYFSLESHVFVTNGFEWEYQGLYIPKFVFSVMLEVIYFARASL